jgi:hypothetical protein
MLAAFSLLDVSLVHVPVPVGGGIQLYMLVNPEYSCKLNASGNGGTCLNDARLLHESSVRARRPLIEMPRLPAVRHTNKLRKQCARATPTNVVPLVPIDAPFNS